MPKWEVRRVSGYGFLKDTPVVAYRDLTEEAQKTLKETAGVKYVGKLSDFVNLEPLFEKYPSPDDVPENEIAALKTCWDGNVLPAGTAYCVITETEDAAGAGTTESVKKAFAMKIEDRVVSAEGDKKFGHKAEAEARKNVGQGDKAEGGVWGVRRKGPPRA